MRLSIDQQNATLNEQAESRLTLDSDRNADLQRESEKRLNMEAAISAVRLLSTESGVEVPPTQRAGVLFTLAQLGHIDLSLTMLDQMLYSDRIDPVTAVYIIDQGLKSSNPATQHDAASFFSTHHERFLRDSGRSEVPRSIVGDWNLDWDTSVRYALSQGLICLLVCRPLIDWSSASKNAYVGLLATIWEAESDPFIKHGVGICLNTLLSLPDFSGIVVGPSLGAIDLDELRLELGAQDQRTTTSFIELNEDLKRWIIGTPVDDNIGS